MRPRRCVAPSLFRRRCVHLHLPESDDAPSGRAALPTPLHQRCAQRRSEHDHSATVATARDEDTHSRNRPALVFFCKLVHVLPNMLYALIKCTFLVFRLRIGNDARTVPFISVGRMHCCQDFNETPALWVHWSFVMISGVPP